MQRTLARQLESAIQQSDAQLLSKLVGKDPALAVATCEKLRPDLTDLSAAAPTDSGWGATHWLAAAGRLCEALRAKEYHEHALRLAQSGERRTARLRFEEAISAALCGEFELCEEVLSQDKPLKAVLSPVVAALAGAPVVLRKAGSSPGTERLHAGAKAVRELRNGRPTAALKASTATASSTFRAAIQVAVHLSRGTAAARAKSLAELLRSSAPRETPALVRAAILETPAEALLELEAEVAASLPKALRRHLLRARLSACAEAPALVAAIVQNSAPEDFPPEVAAEVTLWRGFGELDHKPDRAMRTLAQALASGADLIEAARGNLLAAASKLRHPGAEPARFTVVSRMAEHLIHALEKVGARQEAAVAALFVAELMVGADPEHHGATFHHAPLTDPHFSAEPQLQQRWLRIAREHLDDLGADAACARNELQMAEAHVTLHTAPERALELAELLLAKSPNNSSAGRLRLAAARRLDHAQLEEWLHQAAADSTADPLLVLESRWMRQKSGELRPFEKLTPQARTPGGLLAEAFHYLAAADEQSPSPATWLEARALALPFAQEMTRSGRQAFDAGVLSYALASFGPARCEDLIAQVATDALEVGSAALGPLISTATPSQLEAIIEKLAKRGENGALPALFQAMAQYRPNELAKHLFMRLASTMPRQTVAACQHVLADAALPRILDADLGAMHDSLHPGVCLTQMLRGTIDVHNPCNFGVEAANFGDFGDFDDFELSSDEEIDELGWLLKLFRVDRQKLNALPESQKLEFLNAMDEFLVAEKDEEAVREARTLVQEFGIAKDGRSAPPKLSKPADQKERNQRKRDRKQKSKTKGKRKK